MATVTAISPAASAPQRWDLILLLPNIVIPVPTPFDGVDIRLCAGNDPILVLLEANVGNAAARHMLSAFRTQFGESYETGCIIVRRGARGVFLQAETIRAFRNACALATILPGYSGHQWHPLYADHFDVYPLAPAVGGEVITNDAIVQGLHPVTGFVGQPSPLIQDPRNFHCAPSNRLLARLLRAWRKCFIARRNRTDLLRVFRSIEIALHALRFPTDALLSTQDAGLRLGLWISAFETLLNLGGGGVNLPTVVQFLDGLPWGDAALRRRIYRVPDKRIVQRVTKAAAIYGDLYKARNDFIHGNPIRRKRLWFRGSRQEPLMSRVAPLVYLSALEQRLNLLFPAAQIKPAVGAKLSWLRTAAGRKYMRQRAAEWADRGNVETALLDD